VSLTAASLVDSARDDFGEEGRGASVYGQVDHRWFFENELDAT
jgi:hypothetical protein